MLLSDITEKFKNKKILILGFGREGRSTYLFLRKIFPEKIIGISDQDELIRADSFLKEDAALQFHLGQNYLEGIENYDWILKTPGISNIIIEDKVSKSNISCQTDIFLQIFGRQTIGISGTKGKSTTSFLCFDILKKYFPNVILGGNMGIPLFDIIPQIQKDTIIVCEFSSHQLENIIAGPHISILLNLYQEHLDHYHSYQAYQYAKFNMAKFQTGQDFAIYNEDNEELRTLFQLNPVSAGTFSYSVLHDVQRGCFLDEGFICYRDIEKSEKIFSLQNPRPLKGMHNLQNIMSVINACKLLGVPDPIIRQGVVEFKGLEHRMEYVGTRDGILFYNDSISTIPEATMAAVESLEKVDTLILGGFNRGIDYNKLANYLNHSKIRNLVFVGAAGEQILLEMSKEHTVKQKYITENDYTKIVDWCFETTKKGHICLLSPAASSYDAFKNFEERGRLFKQLVLSH